MAKGIEITVRDLETGDVETKSVAAGDYILYILIAVEPCHLTHTQLYPKSGTHILTVKGVAR